MCIGFVHQPFRRPVKSTREAGPQNLRRRFGTGVVWNTAAVVSSQGSTFVANLLLANILGRAGFGGYAVILGTAQAFAQLGSLGMGSTATRYLAEYREGQNERATAILGFTLSVSIYSAASFALALLVASNWIGAAILRVPELTGLLRLAGLVVFFSILNGYLSGVLAGLERFRVLGQANAGAGLLYVLAAVVGGAEFGLSGAVGGLAVSSVGQFTVLYMAFRRAVATVRPPWRSPELGDDRSIIMRWVVPGVLGGFTSTAALWCLQALMTRQPGGLGSVAVYGAAYNLMTVVLFLPNVANSVGMTLLSNLLGARDANQYRYLFLHNLRVTISIVLFGGSVLGIGGHWILRIYGVEFAPGYAPLIVLLLAAIPESLTIALSQIVLAHERIWTSIMWINVPRDVSIVVLGVLIVPTYGAVGAAAAYLGGRLVGFIATALLVARLGLELPMPRSSSLTSETVLR